MNSKKCAKCNIDKSVEEYYKTGKLIGVGEVGRMAVCKECKRNYEFQRRRKLGKIKGTYGTSRFDYMTKTNVQFGKWTTTGNEIVQSKSARVLCICECGVEKHVLCFRLDNGTSRGCNKCTKQKPRELGDWLWTHIVDGANCRNISVNITKEQAQQLIENQHFKCALTGLDIDFGVNNGKKVDGKLLSKEQRRTASLDRIDSLRGYELENVQWVHKNVNIMKNRFTQQHFINMCRLVTEHEHKI